MMGQHTRLTKVTIFSFPPENASGQFVQKLCSYDTVMIFFKHYSISMGYLKQTKISVSFCKKISYRGKCVICVQFGQNFNTLYHMTWLHFFETWQYNGQKIVVFANFPKKSPFQEKEEFGPNSVQNYSILYLMICHRVFFETFWHDET